MHEDLRRKALESSKTVSRKAQSKTSSRGGSRDNSASNSRAASRVQSRDVSDDEEHDKGNLSDDTNQSINSIDALLEADDIPESTLEASRYGLNEAIEKILDRKGSGTQDREDNLTRYGNYLKSHYLAEALYNRVQDLLPAFLRSIKGETSEGETTAALRALALTAATFSDPTLYDTTSSVLRRSISDSESMVVKAAAIYSLGVSASFGGAGEEEIMDIMTFLQEIAESDGAFVSADDNAEVVAAALNTYGFLATQVEDLEHESEDVVSTCLDQLDAGDVKVQVAAGEVIALLYEKSYTPREEDEESESEDDSPDDDAEEQAHIRSYLIKRYNAYHNTKEVLDKVNGLANLSTKSMGRRDKQLLHRSFATIAFTIENPKLGLQSNSASKMVVRIHREGEMRVDKWWKMMRLNAIRRLLGSGFVNHYFEGNKQVLDALPMIMRGVGDAGMQSPRKMPAKAGKGKYRDQRRFVSGNFLEA